MSIGSLSIGSASIASAASTVDALSDGAVFSETLVPALFPHLVDGLAFAEALSTSHRSSIELVDTFAESDATLTILSLLMAESFAAGETVTPTLNQLTELVDTVLALGLAATQHRANLSVVEALILQDLAAAGWSVSALEAASVTEALTPSITMVQSLLESLAAADSATNTLRIVAAVSDEADITALPVTSMQLFEYLTEGATFYVGISLGGEEYSCYVMNTATKGVVEYENFPFNSLAEFPPGSGRYWGASDSGADGIYELVGTTDAGEQIDSWVRTALNNLGTGKQKRMPSMYVGYASNGTLVLKVITTSEDGTKTSDWYEMVERDASAPRENRIKIGRGIKSTYFAFELHSKDGASFSLDSIELFPMILDRRLS